MKQNGLNTLSLELPKFDLNLAPGNLSVLFQVIEVITEVITVLPFQLLFSFLTVTFGLLAGGVRNHTINKVGKCSVSDSQQARAYKVVPLQKYLPEKSSEKKPDATQQ